MLKNPYFIMLLMHRTLTVKCIPTEMASLLFCSVNVFQKSKQTWKPSAFLKFVCHQSCVLVAQKAQSQN